MVKVSLKTLHYKNKIIKKSINSNLIFILKNIRHLFDKDLLNLPGTRLPVLKDKSE